VSPPTAGYLIPPIAHWLGCHRIDLDDCASTNDEAARLARAGARHGTVVIATTQSAGRGRDGRPWASPPGFGVYLSAVVRSPLPLVEVPPMTLAIGIGLCDAIRSTGVHACLKWPNDALVDNKKIAGVLVEAQSQGNKLEAVVIGIGVNIGGEVPPEIAGIATTLEAASGKPIDREAFIAALLAYVERWIDRYVAMGLEEIIPAWTERMAIGIAAKATIGGAPMIGEVAGLDDDGALLLRDRDGALHRVRTGDVEVIRATSAAC
jgi:BirA family biotin operon repressor/biotin-[acetyl-CoA-carboxylase] ligase